MAIESPRPVRDPNYYLLEESLSRPTWRGNFARELGLEGKPVDRDTYFNLFDGYATNPDGTRGEQLPKYMHPKRRGALDITANNPKTVSIALEVGGDTRIEGVIERARREVDRYVEKHARVKTTKKDAASKSTQPNNLAMIWWDHPASRENDPHRHGHLEVFNLSRDGDTIKGIELRYLDKVKMSKIYRDTMRQGLHELGYKTKRVGKEFEIVGVPAEIKGEFSRRHANIKAREAEYERKKGAPLTSKAKSKLSSYGKPEKPDNMPIEERRAGWRSRISHASYDGLRGLVARAKTAVKQRRWRAGMRQFVDNLHQVSHEQETIGRAPEREKDNGRGR